MKPSIHSNGTSRQHLADVHGAAAEALRRAIEALQEAAPNARDFYVQGDDAFARARGEHEARMHKLADVIHEVNEIAEHIADAGGPYLPTLRGPIKGVALPGKRMAEPIKAVNGDLVPAHTCAAGPADPSCCSLCGIKLVRGKK